MRTLNLLLFKPQAILVEQITVLVATQAATATLLLAFIFNLMITSSLERSISFHTPVETFATHYIYLLRFSQSFNTERL